MNTQNLIELTPATERVINAIAGVGGRPLLVGGCVRDALLGVPSKDIDIEVHGVRDYAAFRKALRKVADVDERGVAFGVLALRVDGEDFDVSLPRRDSKSGRGHRGFEVDIDPDIDEAEAFGRRDFTINALGWDPVTGELIDHFDGVADLSAGVLRHTTDAFTDDPLRVLRGAQFAARFGFTMAPETAELSASIFDGYRELAKERVWEEWRKIVRRGRHISNAIDVLEQTGWINHYPELAVLRGTPQDPAWHPEGDVLVHVALAAEQAGALNPELTAADREVAVLGALVHDFGKATNTQTGGDRITSIGHAPAGVVPAEKFLTDIGAPRHVIDRVLPVVRDHMCHVGVAGTPTRSTVRRLLRRLEPASIYDWARVVDADVTGRGEGARPPVSGPWTAIADELTDRMKPLLRGEHLIRAGWKPGWEFRAVLEAGLAAQDGEEFTDEAGAIAWFTANADKVLETAAPPLTRAERKALKAAERVAATTGGVATN